MIIKRAATTLNIAPEGGVGDLIRGWRGICLEARKSRVQLWRDIRAGRFPPPVELGPNSVAWYRREIEAWKASRPRRRYGSTPQADAT